ncbi:MAG: hypothetical protein A3C93_06315 [Candidatus Lloydbacteria bacterium RIFCSPHIGHO2_02_FULL_54_17]|uniref:Uncharacterized protein n=1 Tax=Candidatus Lloydbacteria bacterium RIFCSPHIGHO2_02_FULL_54_17 TaxID=1798664 RepID=A0A1G2DIA3_9BACT|nr:MAG: hypothetical protein A2762_01360 [Candidatus Lloydbacteria bacterium RIFCSPHIGHO2_01_FULL_54_11]OGZ12691.1 MAG: hypothetical protein A3C93_06315 [Candidatus Lloydbacteria bacterium RIFCSPHIGHO2_02_FULL_54_17]OGZ13543.1 MAG: hypothetical protein A2948_04980 [Candidatus Lloydbacteria bacterium RIFCSPLOWO2_01_FULL_54_18]OGZ16213.1 MAG: hypothetical protein A3H76_03810 [Candidatus Lloydbacteria bacterium RIFCSPLOWO2_02_FULL_54_12]
MKRTLFAALLAGAAFVASAATPVPAPTLPSDLATAWEKVADRSCTKPDGVVVAMQVYGRTDGSKLSRFFLMTKNSENVHQLMVGVNRETGERFGGNAYVKRTDGTWMRYAWETERPQAEGAIANIVGLTWKEFLSCAR